MAVLASIELALHKHIIIGNPRLNSRSNVIDSVESSIGTVDIFRNLIAP